MTDDEWICYHWTLTLGRRGYRLTDEDVRILEQAWSDAGRCPSPRGLPFRADYLWADLPPRGDGPPAPGWREAWRGRSAALYEVADE